MNESDMETAIYVLTIVVIFLIWLFYKNKPVISAPQTSGVSPSASVNVSLTSGSIPGRCNCG